MRSISDLFVAFFALFLYVVAAFILWKFYSVLSRMNRNLEGIRRALERQAAPDSEL